MGKPERSMAIMNAKGVGGDPVVLTPEQLARQTATVRAEVFEPDYD